MTYDLYQFVLHSGWLTLAQPHLVPSHTFYSSIIKDDSLNLVNLAVFNLPTIYKTHFTCTRVPALSVSVSHSKIMT